jgi:hypothetical protein
VGAREALRCRDTPRVALNTEAVNRGAPARRGQGAHHWVAVSSLPCSRCV